LFHFERIVGDFFQNSKTKFAKFKKYNGHSSHVTRIKWAFDDSKLISVGGNDTSVMIWNVIRTLPASANESKSDVGFRPPSSARSVQTELILRNANKGESEDSETDSEDEGYDSDVKREHQIDYNKKIFINQIQRPTLEAVQSMYNKVNQSDRK
jgi:hypothetical protein